uniref:Nucleolar protein 10-like N-terminal domain-containing protein n=1 Tax=Magallana gigas TaxID=29159 RepID=A0A8W8K4R8_MAGGI
MQVSNPNNVKIYNLSAGKSLPEWLSDRQKRSLQKQDIDVRRRIELLQDFDMPTASQCVGVSPDGQYICATGTYKPRLKCFDTAQMSLKFERGLDSDVVNFQFLGEDYGKIVFLQCDRYIELHSQFGRYYRLRIPKYGRDMAYHFPSCDLFVGGIGSEVYRINLEQGRFLSPLTTKAPDTNCCEINPAHGLLACGTSVGTVECFDPRVRKAVGTLDITLSNQFEDVHELPKVTALKFRDALNMAVGTSTGHILLYDIRSNKPLLAKDHHKKLRREAAQAKHAEYMERKNAPKFYEIKDGVDLDSKDGSQKKLAKKSLGERLQETRDDSIVSKSGSLGSREMTFTFKKSEREVRQQQQSREHHKERKNIRRSAGDITKTLKQKPKFWLGKRVK